MADQGKEKSLEMRVAELEDKLAKLHVTEEEMKAYQKVASLLGSGGGLEAAPPQAAASIRTCSIRTCIIRTCIITCITECTCGPCIIGGGGIGGGGFGNLGM